MSAFSPKKRSETAIPSGSLRLLNTASTPALTLVAPTFHRKKARPEATAPRVVRAMTHRPPVGVKRCQSVDAKRHGQGRGRARRRR